MSAPDGFDLVDEPWLLVRGLDGATRNLSLVDTFKQARDLASLAGDVPTQVFALTRVLLAVLHGALRDHLDTDLWKAMWQKDKLPTDDIEFYLDGLRGRFDLFHPDTPFLQVAGLHMTNNEVSNLNRIIADVPNRHPFFSSRMDRDVTLSYSEAARWLVHCHAYDPSGMKSGAVGDPRVKASKGPPIGTGWAGYLGGVLPGGATLLETLLLNLIPGSPADDLPAWERPPAGPDGRERAPTGPMDLFTWQSRRVRLVRAGERVTGVLVCNGDRLIPRNKHLTEPHTAWRRSFNQEKVLDSPTPVYLPLPHDPERPQWRGLQALLPTTWRSQRAEAAARLAPGVLEWISKLTNDQILPKNYPLRLQAIGMTYSKHNSTTSDIVDDAMSLQAILLDRGAEALQQTALSCAAVAEAAATALAKLASTLAEASGARRTDDHRAHALQIAYAALDPEFRRWLASLGPGSDPVESTIAWHTAARDAISALGDRVIADSLPSAWAGRLVNKRWVTTSHAAAWFRRDLGKACSLAEKATSATVPAKESV